MPAFPLQRPIHLLVWSIAVVTIVLLDIAVVRWSSKSTKYKKWGIVGVLMADALIIGAIQYALPALDVLNTFRPPAFTFSIALLTWAAAALILFAITNLGFYLLNEIKPKNDFSAAMVFSIFWGIAAGVAVLISIFFLYSDQRGQSKAFISCLLGAIAGWCFGMYITPQDPTERSQFAKIGAAVAGLASGYTLKGVQDWVFGGKGSPYLIFLILGLICAAITAATIYNTRAYGIKSVKISFDEKIADPTNKQRISITQSETVSLKASVVGEDDSSVKWSVISPAMPSNVLTQDGKFKPDVTNLAPPVLVRIRAESTANPLLIDLVEINVRS